MAKRKSSPYELWEQLPEESSRAFHAFKTYRDMGRMRSHKKLYKINNPDSERTSFGNIELWSKKYSWVKRAEAYDQHLDRIEIAERVESIKEMNARHGKVAMAFIGKVIAKLKYYEKDEKFLKLNPDQVIKWFDTAVKIERTSRGEASDIVKSNHSGNVVTDIDLSKLSEAEFDEFIKLHDKASNRRNEDDGTCETKEE